MCIHHRQGAMGTQSGRSLKTVSASNTYLIQRKDIPKLRGDWIYSIPLHNTQDAKPELRPMRTIQCPSQFMQFPSCFYQPLVLFVSSQQPQNDIVHSCAENRAMPLNVKSPSTVFWILSCKKISSNLNGYWCRYWSIRDVPRND